MQGREEFSADATTPTDEPSRVAEALGNVAVILGSLGCGAVLFGVMMSEALFLGGGGLSMLALLVGYLGYIRSRTARVMLLVGLLGLFVAGMTDSEFPGYVGFAVSLAGLVVGCFGGRNGGLAREGMLLGLLGTLVCLGVLYCYWTSSQGLERPRPIEAESTSEATRPASSGSSLQR